jgi:hypothetical protein
MKADKAAISLWLKATSQNGIDLFRAKATQAHKK